MRNTLDRTRGERPGVTRPAGLEGDLRWLRAGASRSERWLPVLAVVLFVAVVAFRLCMAGLYAKLLHLSFAGGFRCWTADLDPWGRYSGVEIRVRENFDAACLALLFALAFAALGLLSRDDRRRRARLAAYLNELSAKVAQTTVDAPAPE